MNIISLWMANVEVGDVLAQWKSLSPSLRERLVVFTAMALIAVPFCIWAVFFRKSRRRHRHHHHHYPSQDSASEVTAEGDDSTPRVRRGRKWRRPRREHRSRNPTLAETGGLPPARTGQPPEPPI